MARIITQLLLQFIFISLRQCRGSGLPVWVYRVNSCPDPGNLSRWVEASKKLNCYHDLTSTDPLEQAMVYHCLPSSFLNETVEFCGTNVPISPGNCPVYNYQNTYPSYQTCSDFTSGCPTKMFHSKKVYLYPECLKINSKSNCYESRADCSNVVDSSSLKTTTETKMTRQTTTFSIISDNDSESMDSINVVTIYFALSVAVLVVATLIIAGFVLRKRKISFYKYLISKTPETISDAAVRSLSVEMENVNATKPKTLTEGCACLETVTIENDEDQTTCTSLNESDQHRSREELNGLVEYHESEERLSLIDNMLNGAKMGHYNKLLDSLAKHMTSKVFHRIKTFVRERKEVSDKELRNITKTDDLLDYLDKKYLVFNNITFLQGLFLACKTPHLYDRCVEYAKSRGDVITYFETKILESDHTKVKYIINCPNISAYSISELEKLRLMLATLLHASHDDILVSGVKNGCVIVTMMIRNCLIPTLKALYTSEKISMTCHWMLKLSLKYKIMKVMIQDEIIYPPDILQSVNELVAEKNLSSHALQSSFKSEPEKQKAYNNEQNIPKALEYKETSTNCEDSKRSDDKVTNNSPPGENEFTNFLHRLGDGMTDDTKISMKMFLLDFVDHECVGKMKPTKMLDELSDMLKLEYNLSFLEWMFDKCGEPKLVKECQDFSAKNPFRLECFNTNFTPCGESRQLEFQFMVFEIESYRDELQDLRFWLAKTIHVHPGQILMTALKNGPIVVTFLVREKHGDAILEYLKTDGGRIAASRKRIEKIVQNGNVIEIGKALNGSNFVQIRLRLQENSCGIRAGVRNIASIIFRRTGIIMEGNEVYTRTVLSDRKRKETKGKPIKEESFIEKNRGLILENIEPLTIERTDIAYLFDREDLAGMKNIGGRRDRAEYFLKLCDVLPKEKREIACAYFERIVSLPKEISSHEEQSPVKKWIQQNREDLLDEIDSDFIKSTIYHLEDVPEEVKTSWSDPNKGRKEKATIFLDFALQKDEYVKALKKTIEEIGMQFPE